jgi:hypothetical protein
LSDVNADIIVLTETNFVIDPGEEYTPLSSAPLPIPGSYDYKDGENITTIWSKYPIRRIKTRNGNTSVCAYVETPHGGLIVYGTLIGITGRGDPKFLSHLEEQICDWEGFSDDDTVCIAGDFNVTFSDKLYNHPEARRSISECFKNRGITNLTDTKELPNNVDQIAISDEFWNRANVHIFPPRNNPPLKRISDHKMICIGLEFREPG